MTDDTTKRLARLKEAWEKSAQILQGKTEWTPLYECDLKAIGNGQKLANGQGEDITRSMLIKQAWAYLHLMEFWSDEMPWLLERVAMLLTCAEEHTFLEEKLKDRDAEIAIWKKNYAALEDGVRAQAAEIARLKEKRESLLLLKDKFDKANAEIARLRRSLDLILCYDDMEIIQEEARDALE